MAYGASIADITQSYKDDPEKRRQIEEWLAQQQGANPSLVGAPAPTETLGYAGDLSRSQWGGWPNMVRGITGDREAQHNADVDVWQKEASKAWEENPPTDPRITSRTPRPLENVSATVRGDDPRAPGFVQSMRNRAADVVDTVDKGGQVAGSLAKSQWLEPLQDLYKGVKETDPASFGLGLAAFIGPKAKNADLGALREAERLTAAGVHPDEIWRKTMWGKGAEGAWKSEISDVGSHYIGPGSTYKETLHHPELLENYPQLGEATTDQISGQRYLGSYGRGDAKSGIPPSISYSARDPEQARSILLHEGASHGVQDIEGWAKGANTFGLSPKTPAWDIYQERLQAINEPMPVNEFMRGPGSQGDFTYHQYLQQHRDALKDPKQASMLDRAAQEYAVNEAYRRNAAEAEARNVERRRDWSMEARREHPPWTTEDVPRARQLVELNKTYEPQLKKGDPDDPNWHDISGTRLNRPLADVEVKRESTGTLKPQQIMDVDAMKELIGRDLMFTQADRTGAGAVVKSVGGNQLDNDVRLRGGPDFSRENDAAWASAPGVTTQMAKTAAGLQKPVLVPFTMAHGGQDFSNMAAAILAEQGDVLRALPKKDLQDFDKVMREGHGWEKRNGIMVQTFKSEPGWPGLEDLDAARAYLAKSGNGQARKAFVDLLDKKEWQSRGFPNAGEARYAATEPALLNRPTGEAGYSLSNIEPRIFTDPKNQHPAYPLNVAGGYLATLAKPVPTNILAREHIAARRAAGIKPGQGDYRSMQMKPIVQRFDARLLDDLKRFYDENP